MTDEKIEYLSTRLCDKGRHYLSPTEYEADLTTCNLCSVEKQCKKCLHLHKGYEFLTKNQQSYTINCELCRKNQIQHPGEYPIRLQVAGFIVS